MKNCWDVYGRDIFKEQILGFDNILVDLFTEMKVSSDTGSYHKLVRLKLDKQPNNQVLCDYDILVSVCPNATHYKMMK